MHDTTSTTQPSLPEHFADAVNIIQSGHDFHVLAGTLETSGYSETAISLRAAASELAFAGLRLLKELEARQ